MMELGFPQKLQLGFQNASLFFGAENFFEFQHNAVVISCYPGLTLGFVQVNQIKNAMVEIRTMFLLLQVFCSILPVAFGDLNFLTRSLSAAVILTGILI
jgi:low temperature requirement protein LtrA